VFNSIDKNNNGILEPEELTEAFSVYVGPEKAKSMTDQLLSKVDMNKNGQIDFSEYFLANIKETDFNPRNLKSAFDIFDFDNNETLTAGELSKWLTEFSGAETDQEVVDSIIQQMDKNGDGAINFYEFLEFMRTQF
jgi:Ca2+-binding EF-hand superfamily protein